MNMFILYLFLCAVVIDLNNGIVHGPLEYGGLVRHTVNTNNNNNNNGKGNKIHLFIF
jgi:hypothetical protein